MAGRCAENGRDERYVPRQLGLRQQIARISKSAGGTGVSFDDLTKNMVISAGATLYSSYASKQTFRAEVDLKIDITGKILLTGKAIFANTMSVDAYFYANLTDVALGDSSSCSTCRVNPLAARAASACTACWTSDSPTMPAIG